MSKTPYATLLVRPVDDDATIRAAYHYIARLTHPDAINGDAPPLWYAIKEAYEEIKTEAKRRNLKDKQQLLAGVCTICDGAGVTWRRVGAPRTRICDRCMGDGREGLMTRAKRN